MANKNLNYYTITFIFSSCKGLDEHWHNHELGYYAWATSAEKAFKLFLKEAEYASNTPYFSIKERDAEFVDKNNDKYFLVIVEQQPKPFDDCDPKELENSNYFIPIDAGLPYDLSVLDPTIFFRPAPY